MGIGDWGLGIGPNPQSPIPNPQSPIPINLDFNGYLYFLKYIINNSIKIWFKKLLIFINSFLF
jgi:hypothetical protein